MCKHTGLAKQMTQRAGHTFLFFVKFWLEEPATAKSPPLWRGYATNVMSGERRSFQTLGQLNDFLEGFVDQWQSSALRDGHE